jgi:hypothetical protein
MEAFSACQVECTGDIPGKGGLCQHIEQAPLIRCHSSATCWGVGEGGLPTQGLDLGGCEGRGAWVEQQGR